MMMMKKQFSNVFLPDCDECEKHRELVNNICSHHRSHTFKYR